jgi:homoserine kinase type II
MAVYTEVSDEDLARFLDGYGLGRLLSYKGIAEGVENSNYLVHAERGTFILTLYERRVDPKDLPFFLGLMEHLSARGVTCPLPVRDKAGNVLNEISGRPGTLITFLEGVWPRQPKVVHCDQLGTALARMHIAGDGFNLQRKNALGLAGWHSLYSRIGTDADSVVAGLSDFVSNELNWLQKNWPQYLKQGVIHADLFPDNVFFIDDRLSGLIDFTFACNDALAYDLAVCLNAWCFESDGSYNSAKGTALITAYDRERVLDDAERAAFVTLARGAAMRFLLTRTYDWLNTPKDALVARKDPTDYIHRHQRATSLASYLA